VVLVLVLVLVVVVVVVLVVAVGGVMKVLLTLAMHSVSSLGPQPERPSQDLSSSKPFHQRYLPLSQPRPAVDGFDRCK
jgi:hypothetical protein